MKSTFDARKRNLGTEPPSEAKRWRGKLIVAGVCVLAAVAAISGGFVWWSMTHVTTVRASVCAAVVSLASDVDARMAELRVRSGRRVTKGEVLARLDDSALRASLAAADAEKAIKESLCAQAKARCRLVETRVEAQIALAQAHVSIAKGRVESTQAALDLRRAKLPAEIRRARAQRDEAFARLQHLKKGTRKEKIEAAKARLQTSQARAALASFQVKQTETLVARHVESQLELQVMKTELAARKNEVREAELQLAQLLSGAMPDQIEAATQALEAREAALSLARTEEKALAVLAADLSIRKGELREAEVELKHAEAQQVQVSQAEEQIKAAAAEFRKAEAEVARGQATLANMTIVSPVTGTVIRTFDQEGEVCRKGVPTILVADDSAGRWIEGYVNEDDAGLVRVGQRAKAEVIVGSSEYVEATVEAVGLSTSAVSRSKAGSSEGSAMRDMGEMVWVKLRPVEPMEHLLPGMTARAVIRVRGGE